MKALQKIDGFTLPELMVVIAIIAMMTGFGWSAYSSVMKRERVKAAAFLFAGDVKEARMMAIERHHQYTVAFGDGVYTIYRGADDGDIVRQVTPSSEYPGVVILSPSNFPISFNPAGLDATNSSLRTVRFVNKEGCWCDVKITAAGGIRVEEDTTCFY